MWHIVMLRCINNIQRILNVRYSCAALLLLFMSPAALAAAGKVIFVTGQAFVLREQQLPLERGFEVERGDTVITYLDGRVQLLMADGDRIALRPNSRFRIDEFTTPEAGQARDAVSLRRLGKSFYSLLRGGFRTLTNSKGERDLSSYRVRTPVATIGIRGTYYVARFCNNDCYRDEPRKTKRRAGLQGLPSFAALWFNDLVPSDAGAPLYLAQSDNEFAQNGEQLPNGLDVGVVNGEVQTHNDGGSTTLNAGEFTSIKSSEQKGSVSTTAPESLQQDMEEATLDGDWKGLDGDEQGDDEGHSGRRSPGEGGDGDEEEADSADGDSSLSNESDLTDEPEQEITAGGTDLDDGTATPPPPLPVTGGSGGSGGSGGTGGIGGIGGIGGTGGATQPTSFVHPTHPPFATPANVTPDGTGISGFSYTVGPDNFLYHRGTASDVNTGQDSSGDTSLRWGRWSNGVIAITGPSGTTNPVLSDDPDGAGGASGTGSLHWIYANDTPILPVTGSYNYVLIGNTNPTDQNGDVGVLGSASFSANFTNQTVNSTLGLSVGGQNWSATNGNGSFSPTQPGTFSGSYDSVNSSGCTSTCTADGSFSGFFTGGNGSGPPPGAGMTYELNNTNGDQVNGAAAFGDPALPSQ
ncbi:MAG: FecR family protein [Nevskiales bacterium]